MEDKQIKPEKLNLWDRFFNRYKTVIVEEGSETWISRSQVYVTRYDTYTYQRQFVKYKKIDRLTGSEEIVKVYLN